MTTLAERVLELAHAEMASCKAYGSELDLASGVCEATSRNDGFVERYTGGRHEPWCAHWIAYLFRTAGAPIPGDVVPSPTRANPLAGVEHMEEVFRQHGWLVTHPMPGDVMFLATRGNSDAGKGRHVALVELPMIHAVQTLEGNEGDGIRAETRRRTTLEQQVTSYGRRPTPEGWRP